MLLPHYFDHNATTPLSASVLEGMLPWMRVPANPSSRHGYGRSALEALGIARNQLAYALGAEPSEIIFTSGGTEAANLFLKGLASARPAGMLAVSAVEHPCVLKSAKQLQHQGWSVESIEVDEFGRVSSAAFQVAMEKNPRFASVMMANNETGVLQDISTLANVARANGVLFGTDAVQAFGKTPISFRELNRQGVNALWVSAHKVGGPKGIGALVVDKRLDLIPQIAGGGQERGLRSGTENIAAIVGFGLACERFENGVVLNTEYVKTMRNYLEIGLNKMGARIFAQQAERLSNTSFFAFQGIEGETLVSKLDSAGFAVASGSACSSAQPEPSHVLQAMGVEEEFSRGAVRVSLGQGNLLEDVDKFLVTLQITIEHLRSMTAVAVSN
jgi:cysteine desulfurase